MKQPLKKTNYSRVLMRLFFYALFWNLSSDLTAQHFHFKNISIEHGLPSALVYRTFEDKSGYLWSLTDKGISRFDGKEWRVFNELDGFNDGAAYHIAETQDSTIWIISTNFKLYKFRNNRFTRIRSDVPACWIDINRHNRVTIAAKNNRIYHLISDDRLVQSKSEFIDSPFTYSALVDLDRDGFIITNSEGIFHLQVSGRTNVKKLLTATTDKTGYYARAFRRLDGSLLLTNQDGIYKYIPATRELTLLESYVDNEVISFYEDSITNDILLGTIQGLRYYKGGEIASGKYSSYLTAHSVFCIQRNRNGSYYFATKSSGIFLCNFNAVHIDQTEGLSESGVLFVKRITDKIYIFGSNGNIHIYSAKDGITKLTEPTYFNRQRELLRNILVVKDTVIIASYNSVMLLYDGKIKPYYRTGYRMFNYPIRNVPHELSASRIISLDTTHYFLNNRFVYKLMNAVHNSGINFREPIWFNGRTMFTSSPAGLKEFHINTDTTITTITHRFYERISDLQSFPDSTLIIATHNGIVIWKGSPLFILNEKNGLLSNYCSRVYLNNGYIWACTNRGLSRIRLGTKHQPLEVTNFTSWNYLLNDDVNDVCFYKDQVYVATAKGISYFKQDAVISAPIPLVLIENIKLNNRDTAYHGPFILPHDQNNIIVHYNSPAPGTLPSLYKYTFSGNPDTVFTYNTSISYGNLAPGTYELKIWASNTHRAWSEPAVISFSIMEPVWKQLWFILWVSILLCMIAALFVLSRVKNFKKQTEVNNRLLESEIKALRLQMNPHFMYNTLNSIQKYILTHQPLEANRYLARFSRLMRWIIQYSDQQHLSIDEELTFINTYVELEQLRFERFFMLYIEVDPAISTSTTHIPALIIQPFVENAIKHGLNEIEGKGVLSISFTRYENMIMVTIKDNGIGRKASFKKNEGREFSSTGISSTMERLKLLHRQTDIKEPLIITDLYTPDGQPEGTRIDLKLPVIK